MEAMQLQKMVNSGSVNHRRTVKVINTVKSDLRSRLIATVMGIVLLAMIWLAYNTNGVSLDPKTNFFPYLAFNLAIWILVGFVCYNVRKMAKLCEEYKINGRFAKFIKSVGNLF